MPQFTSWCYLRLWSILLIIFITLSTYIEACEPQEGYEIYIMFPEDAAVGSVIGKVKFRDRNDIKQIHSEKSAYVKYDPGTENVTLLKKIDADKESNKITLRLFCEDKSFQTRNVTITVNIIATNVNDNPPRFTERVYYKDISEDTEIGSTIDCGVVAADGDNGDNMRFSIIPRNDHEYFSINLPGRPLITLNQKLDYEKRRHLSIDIMVQDQPEGVNQKKLNDTATINFTVLDADDLNPVFTRKKYFAIVNHNAEIGSVLVVEPAIDAYDPDFTFNETIKFSIDDADTTPYEIQPYNGTIYIKKHLEVGSTTYVIRGVQANNEERFCIALLQVDVLAENDTSLLFSKSFYEAAVVENAPVGTNILTLPVIYKAKAPLIFGFKNRTDVFRIDESGSIRLRQPLDYERTPFYTFLAFVRNSAKLPNDAPEEVYAVVNITVIDLNDNNPKVLNRDLQIEAMRNKSSVIGKLKVYDPDSDTKLTYQLLFFKQYFQVTQDGEIKIIADPSELKKSSYQLMIIVDDGGHPPRRTLVNVTVNFPALVVAEPATGSTLSHTDTLLIVLGVFLTLFVILVILLSIYIARRSLYSTDNLDKTKSDLAKGDPRGKGFKQQKISHSQANTNMTLADELDTVSGSNGCGSNSVQESPFVDGSAYDVQPKDGYKRFKGGSSMESLYSDNGGGSSLDRDTPIHSTNAFLPVNTCSDDQADNIADNLTPTLDFSQVQNGYDKYLRDERPEITVYF